MPDDLQRVLVFAPVGRDGELTRRVLEGAAIASAVCESLTALCERLETEGAGVLLLSEEALADPALPRLAAWLERQPSWSDVPVLLCASGAGGEMSARARSSLESLRHVTLLDRPIRLAALHSAVRASLRGRARQREVRELLEKLRQARVEAEGSNRLKDEFLAMLSHELRTPLNAILGWTSMLTRGQVDAARMPRVFEALDRNAQAQAQLIADVLDVSRIVTGKLRILATTLDLGDLVVQAADSVRPAAAAKEIELTIRDAPSCRVRGDADRLAQVAWNLLSNAVKFTPRGGAIEVAIVRDGATVSLSVTDSGVGISPQFLPFVFERFRQADQTTTRAHGGLGLGLAIVKHLVELHGGTVSAESAGSDRGATFRVKLPADDSAAPVGAASPRRRVDVSLAGRSILVVDDDAATRDVVSAALEFAGARVEVSATTEEAWSVLQAGLPDLLIADLAMPHEDGYSFLRRVRGMCAPAARLPAIALTAHADARSERAARAAGFSAFLAKPARADSLLELVSSLLGASGGEVEGGSPGGE